ncbi:N-acetyl sugar amidotransferase [Nitrospinaceae bacterium]|nr:N-acetyl sugar amidotransferase [Nitrospinaceae bacterium]
MGSLKLEKKDVVDIYSLPTEVKYCTRCVISNQRPRIVFDENNVCNACHYSDHIKTVDWSERDRELRELCDQHRKTDGRFDCVVPSSGGKDSCFVAHQLKHEYGMHPITVTWSPLWYTEIGIKNQQALNWAGFDNITGTARGDVQRRLCKEAMIDMGDPFQPFVYGQVLFPLKIAMQMDIKLVFGGENAEALFGGSPDTWDSKGRPMEEYDKYWFSNKPPAYWTEHGFSEEELALHRSPSLEQVKESGVQRYFFDYFKNWTVHDNYYYALENTGFVANPERTEGTYCRYSSIDDRIDGFHYWFMLLKFGIGRCTANAAQEVREGHRTREEAVQLVRRYDAEFPIKAFPNMLEYCNITEGEFWEICEKWRNENIWEEKDGEWKLKQQVS